MATSAYSMLSVVRCLLFLKIISILRQYNNIHNMKEGKHLSESFICGYVFLFAFSCGAYQVAFVVCKGFSKLILHSKVMKIDTFYKKHIL